MNLFTSLVAYYKLDTVSGQVDLSDATGRQSSLSNFGSVSSGSGKINGCATFNGSNQYLSGPSNLVASGNFSVNFWAYANNTNDFGVLFECGGSFNSYFQNGKISVNDTFNQSSINAVGNFSNNTWYNICIVNDNGITSLYVNGSFVASTAQTLKLTGSLGLGAYIPYSSFYLNGKIDEVGVWSRALSSSEISSLYNGGSGTTYVHSLISDGHGSNCYPDQIDCAGYCNGSSVIDCAGNCGGSASLDTCGVCNGNCTQDCPNGICGGRGGCTDSSACNYDSLASFDDGSCDYGSGSSSCGCNVTTDFCGNCGDTWGCPDSNACNYNNCANQDDGSCAYTSDACGNCGNYHGGCADPNACANYDSCANYDDGSCQYDQGCGCGSGWSGSLPAVSQVLTGVSFSQGQLSYTGTLQPGVAKSKVILSAALGIPIM